MTSQRRVILLLCFYLSFWPATALFAADDNLLAHRLFTQGEYAQAAEIFTDPAWKGVALYRSEQWWRAAEAFVRADDALSAYNLGNCYVKLGYYALALDAYQRALSMDATLEDAQWNADIMRKLLTEEEESSQAGKQSPDSNAIDRIEKDSTNQDTRSRGDGGTDPANARDQISGSEDKPGRQSQRPQEQAEEAGGNQASNRDGVEPSSPSRGEISGEASQGEGDQRPSGGSESESNSTDSQAAGLRSTLDSAQATQQWLNRIQHDPQKFLKRRLQQESYRRTAAGTAAAEGGNSW